MLFLLFNFDNNAQKAAQISQKIPSHLAAIPDSRPVIVKESLLLHFHFLSKSRKLSQLDTEISFWRHTSEKSNITRNGVKRD